MAQVLWQLSHPHVEEGVEAIPRSKEHTKDKGVAGSFTYRGIGRVSFEHGLVALDCRWVRPGTHLALRPVLSCCCYRQLTAVLAWTVTYSSAY